MRLSMNDHAHRSLNGDMDTCQYEEEDTYEGGGYLSLDGDMDACQSLAPMVMPELFDGFSEA